MDGLGIVQPVFETLEPIVPQESGRTVRLLVSQGQEVDADMPVLEYVPQGAYGVNGFARFTKPGGIVDSDPTPDFYREIREQRVQRMGAVSHWNANVHRPSDTRPAIWEYRLAVRFNTMVGRETDVALEEAIIQENERVGHPEFTTPHVLDKERGEYQPAQSGIALRSPDRGVLYSLWATPMTQLFPRTPIAEVVRPDAPVEVLGVIPAYSDTVLTTLQQVARLTLDAGAGELANQIALFDIGRIKIAALDLRLLMPTVTTSQDSYFVRLLFNQVVPSSMLRKAVQFQLVSPRRPRIWFWWKAYQSKDHPRHAQENSPYLKAQSALAYP